MCAEVVSGVDCVCQRLFVPQSGRPAQMSLYDEAAAPAPAGEGELVVPDYTAPAAAGSGPTAMGSDGSTGPPVAKSGLVRAC